MNLKTKFMKELEGKEIMETKEVFPPSSSWAKSMSNAGRKIKEQTGKKMFYEKDIIEVISKLDGKYLSVEKIKEDGFWKEGDTTFMIEASPYPHDEQCEGSMCWCSVRAKKKDPKKWRAHLSQRKQKMKELKKK